MAHLSHARHRATLAVGAQFMSRQDRDLRRQVGENYQVPEARHEVPEPGRAQRVAVPYGCVSVTLAEPTDYPMMHIVDKALAAQQRRERGRRR